MLAINLQIGGQERSVSASLTLPLKSVGPGLSHSLRVASLLSGLKRCFVGSSLGLKIISRSLSLMWVGATLRFCKAHNRFGSVLRCGGASPRVASLLLSRIPMNSAHHFNQTPSLRQHSWYPPVLQNISSEHVYPAALHWVTG